MSRSPEALVTEAETEAGAPDKNVSVSLLEDAYIHLFGFNTEGSLFTTEHKDDIWPGRH